MLSSRCTLSERKNGCTNGRLKIPIQLIAGSKPCHVPYPAQFGFLAPSYSSKSCYHKGRPRRHQTLKHFHAVHFAMSEEMS